MKLIARLAGLAALVGTILPSILYLNGSMNLDLMKLVMLISTIVWFIAAPLTGHRTKLEEIVEESGGEIAP